MADPTPTRLHIDPPIDQWQVTPRNGRTKPVIATGHQPTLWHPGILAKYLAADAIAEHIKASTLNVVVDHNPLGQLDLTLPTEKDAALGTSRFKLVKHPDADVLPPNRLAIIDSRQLLNGVIDTTNKYGLTEYTKQGLSVVARAFSLVDDRPADLKNLSTQVAAALGEMMRPYLHQPMPALTTSEVVTPRFVDRLLADPVGCVRCYNRAAWAYPQAGIRPLYLGRDVIESPLWAQVQGVCTPVFIDIGESKAPFLFTQGQDADLTNQRALAKLRPRAITLSAIMRSELCDLFIHGSGGGLYDQVTERWWKGWTGEDLAPKAVVSADMYLPFDVPIATAEERARSQWFAHHLPHNVDRYALEHDRVDAGLADEKRELLDRMHDDRDKRRRAKAFKRIHAINAQLRERHAELMRSAQRQADDSRIGLTNAAIARRRDWCFALYGTDQLDVLKQRIRASLLE